MLTDPRGSGAEALSLLAEDFGSEFVEQLSEAIQYKIAVFLGDKVTCDNKALSHITEDFGSEIGELLDHKIAKVAGVKITRADEALSRFSEDFGSEFIELLGKAIEYKASLFFKAKGWPRRINLPENKLVHVSSGALPIHEKKITAGVQTALHKSPFLLLGATTRDDRRKIIELAEEKSLFMDSDICTKARSDLTTTRNRLAVEMAWLPGISPKRAATLVDTLHTHIDLLKGETSIPALSNANLVAAAFELLDSDMNVESWCEWIVYFAYTVDMIESEDVLRDINEDRSVSGFSEVKGVEQIDVELCERRRYYTDTIKIALDGLESMKLVEVVTAVVEQETGTGEGHAPQLIHELVDRYETEANRYLQPEAENIKKLIDAIREAAAKSVAAAKPLVERLDRMARKWDAIAQPIQLSMKAQGLDHDLSHDVAWAMRSLAVDLFNKHDMLDIATRLNQTLQELFAELPAVVERLEEDSSALDDIFKRRKKAESCDAEWARSISYEAEFGLFFKDKFRIGHKGIEWKKRFFPMESIRRIAWGGTTHYTNGINTGTTYKIIFGPPSDLVTIELRDETIYSAIIDRLWRAIGVRLLTAMLEHWRDGGKSKFGDATIDDSGIDLPRHGLFARMSSKSAYCNWSDVRVFNSGGELHIKSERDEHAHVSLGYSVLTNVVVLGAALRIAKEKDVSRLSDILV